MTNDGRLTAKQFQEAGGLDDWRVLAFGASAWFDAPSHAAGAGLVARIAELTGDGAAMPDADLRGHGVHVRIVSSDSGGFTSADVEAAREISAAARALRLTADPAAVQNLQVSIDAADTATVLPFWRTVLGYEQPDDDTLVDPLRRDPPIWFQESDEARPLRTRIHLDIARPHRLTVESHRAVTGPVGGEADRESGGESGGESGDYYATVADAEGNEADLIPLMPADEAPGGPETADWRELFGVMTYYPVDSLGRAVDLVAAAAELADTADMPMLIDLRPGGVVIDTGKDQGEDPRFAGLAAGIQAAARALGLTADVRPLRFVQIGIAVLDIPTVREFWRVALGYRNDPRDGVTDLYDPRRLNPPIFFLQMPASEVDRRRQRNRVHVDVYVPDDQARARIDAAVAAGGRVVYDDDAPEWWTLADPEGNEVDIAVTVGREELWSATHAAQPADQHAAQEMREEPG